MVNIVTHDHVVIWGWEGRHMGVTLLSIGNVLSNKFRLRNTENVGAMIVARKPIRQELPRKAANDGCMLE